MSKQQPANLVELHLNIMEWVYRLEDGSMQSSNEFTCSLAAAKALRKVAGDLQRIIEKDA